jgi:hypothetical protein
MLLLLNGVAAYSCIVYEDMHDNKLYKETQSLFYVWGAIGCPQFPISHLHMKLPAANWRQCAH